MEADGYITIHQRNGINMIRYPFRDVAFWTIRWGCLIIRLKSGPAKYYSMNNVLDWEITPNSEEYVKASMDLPELGHVECLYCGAHSPFEREVLSRG